MPAPLRCLRRTLPLRNPHGVRGNGANDAGMLRLAAIGVAVLAAEGVAISALHAADVLVSGPIDAIELVLKPKRLVATLRG